MTRANGRLVVVSNRLPEPGGLGPPKPGHKPASVGGLVSALKPALLAAPEAVWLGWSGRSGTGRRATRTTRMGPLQMVGLDLTPAEVEEYYDGFCNRTLWPLLHTFPQRVVIDHGQHARWREVNQVFARALARRLRPGDRVWVHDYHLIGLGAALREAGFAGPVGFFLHVPFPPHDVLSILPWAEELLRDLLGYDLVGFHTRGYAENYLEALSRELRGQGSPRTQRVGVYPIGIDPTPYKGWTEEPDSRLIGERLRLSLQGRHLVLGVDRLDYSKGIPERLRAFGRLLELHPEWRRRVSYVQISAPSRTKVSEYVAQRREVEALVGHMNGKLGEPDWVPIRYVFRAYSQRQLASLYRLADVGFVAPLRDGMNLVAKEFVAAQGEGDPGVLVLSRFAGAVDQLSEAVLVNPYDADGTAHALARALELPWAERVRRQQVLLRSVREETAERWARSFLRDLGRKASRRSG